MFNGLRLKLCLEDHDLVRGQARMLFLNLRRGIQEHTFRVKLFPLLIKPLSVYVDLLQDLIIGLEEYLVDLVELLLQADLDPRLLTCLGDYFLKILIVEVFRLQVAVGGDGPWCAGQDEVVHTHEIVVEFVEKGLPRVLDADR